MDSIPDDVNKEESMAYFFDKGKVTRCRYLIARGAECRTLDDLEGVPMVL
jgi:hypothetical protein